MGGACRAVLLGFGMFSVTVIQQGTLGLRRRDRGSG